jgi:TRAP-type transport system periplasmic protein
VLASRFQEEMIRRMDASPVAMTLADVLPALQGGTIDGTLTTITQYTTLHYVDAAKYVVQTDQPFVSTIAVLSKKWVDSLPPDLQKIVRDDAAKTGSDIFPFVREFFDAQVKIWTDSGGQLTKLPPEDKDELNKRASGIAIDLSKDKPDLSQAVKLVMESAARNK